MKRAFCAIAVLACLSTACDDSSQTYHIPCPPDGGVLDYINIDSMECTPDKCSSAWDFSTYFERGECPHEFPYCGQDISLRWYCARSKNDCMVTQHAYASRCEDDSLTNCGAHEKQCRNIIPGFKDGVCEYRDCYASACESGFELKNEYCIIICKENAHPYGGICEDDTVDNCGAHGHACYIANAGFADGKCIEGQCIAESCEKNYVLVDNKCTSTCDENQHNYRDICEDDTIDNCGAHEYACVAETAGFKDGKCENGKCIAESCEENYELVDGKCVSTCPAGHHNFENLCEADSLDNCGAHGSICHIENYGHSTEVECVSGACTITICEPGFILKDNHCEKEGGTSFTCNTNEHRYDSSCEENSLENCGNHGTLCTTVSIPNSKKVDCTKGTCEAIQCADGYELSSGKCINPSNDAPACSEGLFYCEAQNACCSEESCQGTCKSLGEISCQPNQHEFDGGCEADTTENCGSHGNACSVQNGTASCTNGRCTIASCNAGYHLYENICEQDSNDNCGSHANACSVENGTASCANGRCTIASCNAGYHLYENICELDSNENCGSHANACSADNGTASCINGSCTNASCNAGYHLYENICEPDSDENCGSHERVCYVANGDSTCSNGTCVLTSCDAGYHAYEDNCEANSNTNCGSHGNTCYVANGSSRCYNGNCSINSCNSGYHVYGNTCEQDTLTHCGSHNHTCSIANGKMYCSSGNCVISSCNPGYKLSGNTCKAQCPDGMVYCTDDSCCQRPNCAGACLLL